MLPPSSHVDALVGGGDGQRLLAQQLQLAIVGLQADRPLRGDHPQRAALREQRDVLAGHGGEGLAGADVQVLLHGHLQVLPGIGHGAGRAVPPAARQGCGRRCRASSRAARSRRRCSGPAPSGRSARAAAGCAGTRPGPAPAARPGSVASVPGCVRRL
ncbi:hypothetical protein G6F66_014308 [Rhizopus arrhizus]|nr:hypothetical protein G6F66_014308 [Rhizopus arrhizus]